MALSSALMNKGDYKYRQSNLQLREMAIQDELQRTQDLIKIVEKDTKRVTDAEDNWDKAVKADAQKDSNNGYVTNRQNVLKSADYKFATSVGVNFGEYTAKLDKQSAYSKTMYNGKFETEDNFYLTQLQNKASSLELEQDSIETQLKSIEGTLKGLDGLVSNAAQDNAFWAIGG